MSDTPESAVYDCNVLLGAILSTRGANHACVELVRINKVRLCLSPQVLRELRMTPLHPELRRFTHLTPDRVEALIADLLPRAHYIEDAPAVFEYARDPDDAHYINLALVANAIYVVSRDNDLLDLNRPNKRGSADFMRRFPQLRIMEPIEFLKTVHAQ